MCYRVWLCFNNEVVVVVGERSKWTCRVFEDRNDDSCGLMLEYVSTGSRRGASNIILGDLIIEDEWVLLR